MAHVPEHHRSGEIGHFPSRSDRLYCSADAWHFLIRGGQSMGTYTNADEAKLALKSYIDTLVNLQIAFHRPCEEDHHMAPQQKARTSH